MAKEYKCDICKEFYTEDSLNKKHCIGKNADWIFMYLDLCPDCFEKFSALIAGDAKIVMQKDITETIRWIPVSKELPEENAWYHCTVELSDFHNMTTMDLYFKNGKWLDNRRIDMFHCYDIYGFIKSTERHKLDYSELLEDFDWTERVVAWMPLPKPFLDQEERKNKEKNE